MGSRRKISKVQELETFLQELRDYRHYRLSQANNRCYVLRNKLLQDSGRLRSLITELTGKERIKVIWIKSGRESSCDTWFTGLQLQFNERASSALNYCIDITIAAIGKLKADIEMGIRDEQGNLIDKSQKVSAEPPKAFIAHGGKTVARDKLEDFLTALGVTPTIVEEQPSQGRSKDKNVEYYLKQCDCAVILATKGDVDSKTGEFIPRGNILIEVGRCQERFPNRTIYLLERGTKFPTNIDEKVWERFTEENMDKAFIKVAKELRAFGLIKAVKG